MHWTWLTDDLGWQQFLSLSTERPVFLFKHSHRCSLSSIVKIRLEEHFASMGLDAWIIDVVSQRKLSQLIAVEMGVIHESPQALIVHTGECIWDEDHLDIHGKEVACFLGPIRTGGSA